MDFSDPARTERLLACLQTALGHELPNRLVAIQGLIRMVETDAADRLGEDQCDLLRRGAAVARRAHRLVEELAHLVRETRQPTPPGEVDLREVVREVAAEVKQVCPRVTVEAQAFDGVPVKLSALVLRPILVRLAKALAQGAGSSPRVEIGAAREDGQIRLWVSGDGPAWPADKLARAFEPFTEAASEDDAGLGLYLLRHAVEGSGGRVSVTAGPVRGTTFTLAWKDS